MVMGDSAITETVGWGGFTIEVAIFNYSLVIFSIAM
jgi:hypothetical protein